MNLQMRNGYENYEFDLHKSFDFLLPYIAEIVEERSDGSFYVYCIRLSENKVKTIRIYHEFAEQQLLITLQINHDYFTTLEINRKINAVKDEDLRPKGDDYLGALYSNAQVIKRIVEEDS